MLKLLVFETVHQLRLFARRPAAVFFVIVMPVLLLVIFTEIFGNEEIVGQGITTAQLHTPTLAVFGLSWAPTPISPLPPPPRAISAS